MLQEQVCGRVIVCNNQPKTDIHDHLNSSDSRVEIIQSDTVLGPVKRHQIAQSRPKDFFVRIDDDVFKRLHKSICLSVN